MDRLQRALDVYLRWSTAPVPQPPAELLAAHPDLHDLLELMLQDRAALDAAATAPASGEPRRLGEFELHGEIGRGGMGVVYEGRQPSLDRRVAIKVLPGHLTLQAASIARFKREALTMARLEHAGIVKVFAVGSDGDTHWFAMERIDGDSLDRMLAELRKSRALPPGHVEQMVALVAEIASALHFAHEAGVVHRDVKPSNVLLRQDGTPVLTDFGLAYEEALPAMTHTRALAGTPYYLAPERIDGARGSADRRSDVFALGVTLFELLTLERPFDGTTTHDVLQQILQHDPPDPRRFRAEIGEDLAAVVLKALEKDPRARYATAAAFAHDLQAVLAHQPVAARHATWSGRVRRWVRREPALAAAAGALVLLLAAGLGTTLLLLGRVDAARSLLLREAGEKAVAIEQLLRLSDDKLLADLGAEQATLWPLVPERAVLHETWLRNATQLLARLPQHEATLAKLRHVGARTPEQLWQLQLQERLVQALTAFRATVDNVRARRERIDVLTSLTRDSDCARDAWERARAAIRANPLYGGLDLPPQWGLLPIGADPRSRLHEFWVVQSGSAPQWNDAAGVVPDPEMAIVLVLLPGGRTHMGTRAPSDDAPAGARYVDPMRQDIEPLHELELAPFFIGKYELTQAQWRAVMGENPSYFKFETEHNRPGNPIQPHHPVEGVTWDEAVECGRKIGLVLPTEAQWEYAARAGTTTIWSCGNEPLSLRGHANLADRARHDSTGASDTLREVNDGYPLHAPVGTFAPNAFGLHDVHGNVREWCRDWVQLYSTAPAPGTGLRDSEQSREFKVVRGGCYENLPKALRSGARHYERPTARFATIGLRVARPVEGLASR